MTPRYQEIADAMAEDHRRVWLDPPPDRPHWLSRLLWVGVATCAIGLLMMGVFA